MSRHELGSPLKWLVLAVLTVVFLNGCKPINQFFVKITLRPAADSAVLLGESVTLHTVLESEDTLMSCVGNELTTGLIMSTMRMTHKPTALGTLLHFGLGTCEEERAFVQELEYLKYIRAQMPDMAQDSLIQQKSHHMKAAKRFQQAWDLFSEEYKQITIGDSCPELEQSYDQLVWLVGVLAGGQALNHDQMSGIGIGVPKNIAAVADRAMGCLPNEKWFGIPLAFKALIWSLLPGALPEGEDNWARFEEASRMGEASGVRIPHLLYLIAAHTKGDDALARKIIKRHVESLKEVPTKQEFALFDTAAKEGIERISDRMWAQATGHRTPNGGLGTFWDENAADDIETVDLDDLF
jgi:hypothetical protein